MAAWHAEPQPAPAADPPPTLVLHGVEDRVIPAVNAAPLAVRWNAETRLFPGAGHGLMAQEPEALATLLAGFLSATNP